MPGRVDKLCLAIGHVWQETGVPGWYRCVRSSQCKTVGVCPSCVVLSSVPAGVELMVCREHDYGTSAAPVPVPARR